MGPFLSSKIGMIMGTCLGLVVSLWSTLGFSYGATQCKSQESDPSTTLERVEEEIWGANTITWLYNGQEISSKNVTLDAGSIRVISTDSVTLESLGQVSTTHYSINAIVALGDGSSVSLLIDCNSEDFSDLRD